jgi:predicted permease
MPADIRFAPILLFAMLGVGVLAMRLGYLTDSGVDDIGKLVLNVTFPALILASLFGYRGSLTGTFFVLPVVALIGLFVALGIGLVVARALKLAKQRLFASACTVANTAFIGIPVNRAVNGSLGGAYGVMGDLPTGLVIWGVCVPLMTSERAPGDTESDTISAWTHFKRALFNPNLIALFVGLVLILIGVRPPRFAMRFIDLLGSITAPLAMMMIGVVIARGRPSDAFRRPVFWLVALVKLALNPAVALALAGLFGLHGPARTAAVLQAGMPTLASLVLISRAYGQDDSFAASAVFLTTLLSLITIPLWVYLVG